MANQVYHIGHEPPQVTAQAWRTNAGTFDSVFSRCAAFANATPVTATLAAEVEANTADGYWVNAYHYAVRYTAISVDGILCLAEDGSSSCLLHYTGSTGQAYVRVYADDNSYVDSSSFSLTPDGMHTLHCYAVTGAVHVDYYKNFEMAGSAAITGTGRGIKTLRLNPLWGGSNGGGYWSELTITNFDLTGHRVKTLPPIGSGTYSETTGGWNSISEIVTDSNDARFTSLDQRLSYDAGGLNEQLLNRPIVAVCNAAYAYTDGVNNLRSFLRIDGVDYEGEVVKEASATVGVCKTILLEDPATVTGWVGDLSNVEFGFKSVAP